MTAPRVIVALCYADPDRFYIIPECPYCYCSHKHRVPNLHPLPEKHTNGALVTYTPGMPIKLSDCLTEARSYVLELRPKEELGSLGMRPRCRGLTLKGNACKRYARPTQCVCTAHFKQLHDIVSRRLAELYGT